MKTTSQRAMEQAEEPVESAKRKPDFLVKVRQPPIIGADGKRYLNPQFSPIGAAWKQLDKNGKEFIGVKINVPGMLMPESFVLFPPYEEDR